MQILFSVCTRQRYVCHVEPKKMKQKTSHLCRIGHLCVCVFVCVCLYVCLTVNSWQKQSCDSISSKSFSVTTKGTQRKGNWSSHKFSHLQHKQESWQTQMDQDTTQELKSAKDCVFNWSKPTWLHEKMMNSCNAMNRKKSEPKVFVSMLVRTHSLLLQLPKRDAAFLFHLPVTILFDETVRRLSTARKVQHLRFL